MKKIILVIFFNILIIPLFSYELNKNINIRFGLPSDNGIILYKKGFVLLYDINKKVSLWASYYLTKKYYNNRQKLAFSFCHDPQLKKGQRAEIEDYKKTIYYPCKLVPHEDMARDKVIMRETYYFSNICPMDKDLYNNCWKKLENSIRNFVMDGNDVWVVTGPIF
ncbi:MAG: DNA/RNA non-specific endonuclease, partial [Candidatus Goldbacteria bacterium]|nr:DNA/RNA non-specific endonuclease [Candidatus Goldiibacteriota bacterium]